MINVFTLHSQAIRTWDKFSPATAEDYFLITQAITRAAALLKTEWTSIAIG